MAKQRSINTKLWDKGWIVELESHGKLLWVYLLTNSLTNIAGCYEISVRRMWIDTKIEQPEIEALLEHFENKEKIIYRDGYLLIRNFIKHQSKNPTILKGIAETVKCCPNWVKDRLCIDYEFLSHLNLNLNSNSNSNTPSDDGQREAVEDKRLSEPGDPVMRRIWKDGVDLLTASGLANKNARSLLGKLAKEYTNERLAECIAVTQAANPVNAEEFLIGTLKARKNGSNQNNIRPKQSNAETFRNRDASKFAGIDPQKQFGIKRG